ncbi:MAG: HDOD domain-containing protein [Acidobacteriota bacterium]
MATTLTPKPIEQDEREQGWALRDLPPFPVVATQLLKALADDNVNTLLLVNLIRRDAMFTSELLRAVNSARYAISQPISSIQHAVTILGRDTLRSFAVAVSLRMYLGRTIQHEELARVWRHSLATATICDLLCEAGWQASPSKYGDIAYVAGLLHDVGCLGLMTLHPKGYAVAVDRAGREDRDLREIEREIFGMDHCRAGQLISRSWRFSPDIEEVSFGHHEPSRPQDKSLGQLVKVAVLLTDALGWSVAPSTKITPLEEVFEMIPTEVRNRLHSAPDEFRAIALDRAGMLDRPVVPRDQVRK